MFEVALGLMAASVVAILPWVVGRIFAGRHVWRMVLAATLWLAIVRSSAIIEAPELVTVLYLVGLCLLVVVSYAERSSTTNPDRSTLYWYWTFIAYAALVGAFADAKRELPALLLVALVGLVASSAWQFRWGSGILLQRDMDAVFWSLISAIAVSGFVGVVGVPSAQGIHGGLQGVFANPNYLGLACVIVAPLALGKFLTATPKGGFLGGGAYLLAVSAVLLTGSRGSLAAVILGSLVTLALALRGMSTRLVRMRATALGFVLIFVLLAAAPLLPRLFSRAERGSDFLTGRGEIWFGLLDRVGAFGHGMFSIQELTYELDSQGNEVVTETLAAHNVFLQILVGVGLVGFVLWLGFLLSIFRGARTCPLFVPLCGSAAGILAYELVESSITGGGGPLTAACWIILFGTGAAARLRTHDLLLRSPHERLSQRREAIGPGHRVRGA